MVINGLDVVPRRTPGSDATGRPLDDFAIRFVHGESPTMLRVGPRQGGPEGWVPRDSVVEWDTRLMARPAPRGSRPALVMYRDEPCLASAVAGRRCPNHAERCPTEGEEPADDGPDAALGWPVLRSKSIPGPDGSPRTIYEVAALVADRAPPTARPEQIEALRPALKGLYVAFVIDTTASMRTSIAAARSLATGMADRVARDHADMLPHLALIEYRDNAPGYGFRARLTTKFTEVAGFRAYVDALAAASPDDGSPDESALDGIALALPSASGGLGWPSGRSGELATKLIVLIGDAPDHARDLGRATALAERARAAGISIAAVMLDGTLIAEDRTRLEAQWRTLAEGSYRPTDRAGMPSPPLLIRIDQADALATRLQALIDDRMDRVRAVAAHDAAEAESRLKAYVDGRGRTLPQVAPVLVDLHRGEPVPTPRPDPRFNGRKAPSIRRGWVARTAGSAEQLNVDILMARDEVDALIAEFAALQQATAASASADLPAVAGTVLRVRSRPADFRRLSPTTPPSPHPPGQPARADAGRSPPPRRPRPPGDRREDPLRDPRPHEAAERDGLVRPWADGRGDGDGPV